LILDGTDYFSETSVTNYYLSVLRKNPTAAQISFTPQVEA
jgi:hypothetical protein